MTAKTTAQRKANERQRKAEQGLAEVRGIWAPPERHKATRDSAAAAELLHQRRTQNPSAT